jgi:serine/threonine protein phosphatase PrpC
LSATSLQRHLDAAQQAILEAQKKQPSLSTMRTTIVILLTDSKRALWAHVGDSRLYCLEKGRIDSYTKDHSVVQAMVSAGELPASRIRHHEDRNRLLRCLGNSENDIRPTLSEMHPLHNGTSFLLCTDGFWENVTEPEIEIDFAKAERTQDWLALMEHRLLERAPQDNDNYTAIAVIFQPEGNSMLRDSDSSTPRAGAALLDKTTLLRLGIIAILLISTGTLGFRIWGKVSALQRQVEDLTKQSSTLTQQNQTQQQKLDALQKQLQDCQAKDAASKGTASSGQTPAKPTPKK